MGKKMKVVFGFVVLTVSVMIFSMISSAMWGGKPETGEMARNIAINSSMTLKEFASVNSLENTVLKDIFSLSSKGDLDKMISDYDLSEEAIIAAVNKARSLANEEESKNWVKILLKFIFWIVFLNLVFRLIRKNKINHNNRKLLLAFSVLVSGVILGADPSPMGTVKDAVVLFGRTGTFFPPRAAAFILMMAGGIFIANKFLCSWGCQAGVFQDLVFRLNRNKKDTAGIFRQYKIPFLFSNSIRVLFFAAVTVFAFAMGRDIIDPVDPFRIFNPAVIGAAGVVFIAVLIIASLFVYRPWCHLFCPFGLAGWVVEKISIFRIRVDRDKCIECGACEKACPTDVMGSILNKEKVIPDCFSCGTCIEICPVNAIEFKKRDKN